MRLNNRTKESTFAHLNDHHEIKPNRWHRGNHVILKRDKRARISDLANQLANYINMLPCDEDQVEGMEIIDKIMKEVEK